MHIRNLFDFDKFVSPVLIRGGYWVGMALIVLKGLSWLFSGFAFGFFYGIGAMVMTCVSVALALIVWRVICEGALVLFSINDRVRDMNHSLDALKTKDTATDTVPRSAE